MSRSLVALYARAWIEIEGQCQANSKENVALYARAWVEIANGRIWI